MSTIQTGWLKNKNGERFAPKTLTSQVQTSDGVLLEDKIKQDLNTKANKTHTHPDYALKSDITNIDLSNYETKSDASSKLAEAKSYADSAASTVKNDLLNGAGAAYDTLKELGDLINENNNALDALETVASGKADKGHTHNDYALKTDVENINTVKDWNQNNETQPDYVKNRTHWIEEGIVELLAETTVTLNGGEGLIPSTETSMVLVEGETYFVTYNNEEYECVAGNYDIIGDGSILLPTIGNLGAIAGGESSGEPFVIVYVASEHELTFGFSGLMIADINEATEATVSVSKICKIYHKLDRNFIDYNSDWNAKEGEYGYIENRTHYDNSEVILPELSCTLGEEQESCSIYYPITLEEGKEYIVNWNGVEYTCSVKTIEMDGYTAKYLGNAYVYGAPGVDDTGEPFLIGIIPPEEVELVDGLYAEILPLDGSTSLIISITKKDIHYLDPKYIKDMYGEEKIEKVIVNATSNTDGSSGNAQFEVAASETLVDGNTYIVTWNGVEYNLTAYMNSLFGVTFVGNLSIVGIDDAEDTGEPFIFGVNENGAFVIFNDRSTSQSIKIIKKEIKTTKIDKKFLPDEVFYDEKINDKMSFTDMTLAYDIYKPLSICNVGFGIANWYEGAKYVLANKIKDYNDASCGLLWSYNGFEWFKPNNITRGYKYVCSSNVNCRFIAKDEYNNIAYSEDGIDWNEINPDSIPTECETNTLCYVFDKFIIFTYSNEGSELIGNVYYSTDGITWQQNKLPVSENIYSVTLTKYNDVISAIAVGSNGTILKSLNGVDWEQINSPVESDIISVASTTQNTYRSSYVVALTKEGIISSNNGGSSWKKISDVVYDKIIPTLNGEKFVCMGEFKSPIIIQYRDNVIKPADATYSYNGAVYDLMWYEDTFFLVTSRGIFYSYDGIGWYDKYVIQNNQNVTKNIFDLCKSSDSVITDRITVRGVSTTGAYENTYYQIRVNQDCVYIYDHSNSTTRKLVELPTNITAGSLLMYNGNTVVSISKQDLIAEIIAALPSAEGGSF